MQSQKLNRWLVGALTVCPFVFGAQAFAGKGEHGHGHKAETELKMMDTDGDGKLSSDEHSAGAKKMFETMDANKDGTVTATEMSASHEQVMGKKAQKSEMSAADKIKKVDLNNDGMLTGREHQDASRAMFDKMDTNKDGFLTKEELGAGHKMMRKAKHEAREMKQDMKEATKQDKDYQQDAK